MDINILNSDLKIIKRLNKFKSVQYSPMIRDIGTFKLIIPLIEEHKFLLNSDCNYYVLIDSKIFGKIYNIVKTGDNEQGSKELIVEGELSNTIFKKRVINNTFKYNGLTYDYVLQLIIMFLNKSPDEKRNINITNFSVNAEVMDKVCNSVHKQTTGGYLWDEIKPTLEQDMLGIHLYPNIVPTFVNEKLRETNVDGWTFKIYSGSDRTLKSQEQPVSIAYDNRDRSKDAIVFSQGLSNIYQTDYYLRTNDYCTNAYIAGEGKGIERKMYEYKNPTERDSTDLSGWNRSELWIDARDIQSEKEDGTILNEQQYEKEIIKRANEKFSKHRKDEMVEAVLVNDNKRYKFNKDYFLGDIVTIVDEELGKMVNAQIIGYRRTILDNRDIFEIIVSYGKSLDVGSVDIIDKQNKTNSSLEDVVNNIKYLNNISDSFSLSKMTLENKSDYLAVKWENGLMLLVQSVYAWIDMSSSWGNIYYGTVDLGKWKVPFKEAPWVLNVRVNCNTSAIYSSANTVATATNVGIYDFSRPTTMSGSLTFNVVALGYWK